MSTYTPISTVTLASDASEIVFTGLPQTYTDLVIMGSIASADTSLNRGLRVQLNSDTGNNYSRTGMYWETSAVSFRESSTSFIGTVEIPPTTSGWGSIVLNLQNYSNTTTNKTVISKGGAPANQITASVGLWRNTAAITSVRFFTSGSNIRSGSTLTVYGIGAGSPKAFGGDEVRTDGTYWYHIYRSSGIFAPTQNLSCDYVVVAGGGGGAAGGSGAGGFKTSIGGSALSLTAGTNNTVTIGAGGTGATVSYNGSSGRTAGSNSVFASITATGGGPGGGYSGEVSSGGTAAALGGGSGGGASYSSGTAKYGLGTSGEGNNGGQDLFDGTPYSAAGGGGAGAVGQNNQSSSVAGNGGAGTFNAITNSALVGQLSGGNYYVAGGGGGGIYGGAGSGTAGTGGLGGGGAGSNGASATTTGVDGTANTGGGAGGSSYNAAGRQGGSGVVIVRYAI
jgi:hypothetical protein